MPTVKDSVSPIKYHLSKDTGRPNLCRAPEGECPIDPKAPHFPSKDAARTFYEKTNATFSENRKQRKNSHGNSVGQPKKNAGENIDSISVPPVSTTEIKPEENLIETYDSITEDDDSFVNELNSDIDVDSELREFDEDLKKLSQHGLRDDECEICGEEDASVRQRKNRYEEIVHGEFVMQNMCADCFESVIDGI